MAENSNFSESHEASVRAVRNLYNGTQGELFALLFGEQIHLGGINASAKLAALAKINQGHGVDLCCCYGAGMRYLLRYQGVDAMTGVDIATEVLEKGAQRAADEGHTNISFVCEDACATHLESGLFDFVWSEDAWCYVPDKPRLISEAVRIVKPGGTIAFTDWVEGEGLDDEARNFVLAGMAFPNLETLGGYRTLLEDAGCEVIVAEDSGLLGPQISLAVEMLDTQTRWDALKIVNFEEEVLEFIIDGLRKIAQLGEEGKLRQARIVARATT